MELKRESEQPLKGMRILVADDEFLIASGIEEYLQDAGAEIRRAGTVSAALREASGEALSAALLDVHLGRQTTEGVADVLVERDIPFLFYSGEGLPGEMREKHPDAKVLIKPVPPRRFIDALLDMARN